MTANTSTSADGEWITHLIDVAAVEHGLESSDVEIAALAQVALRVGLATAQAVFAGRPAPCGCCDAEVGQSGFVVALALRPGAAPSTALGFALCSKCSAKELAPATAIRRRLAAH